MLEPVRVLRRLRQLNRNAELDRAAIERLRERQFRELLRHAWDNTRFYPGYYGAHGIDRDDLDRIPPEELPPIDKETYVENFDDLTVDDALTREAIDRFVETHDREDRFRGEYTIVHTSGTTGEPTYFVYDRAAWETVVAAGIRAVQGEFGLGKLLAGLVTGYRVAYVAATRGRFGGVMAVDRGTASIRFESMLLDVNRPLAEWASRLDAFDPDVLVGYPSAVELVCDLVADGDLELDVFRVITGGEPLLENRRRYVERTLGTEIFDVYGASESIIVGVQRSGFDGMYLFDDLNYVEPARTVTYVTPLYNYSQPLIRYELDDKLVTASRDDDEPLPFTKVESVAGRSEELMWFETADGEEEFLHPLVLDDIEVDGLERYQFVQRSDTAFDVRLVRDSEPDVDLDSIERQVAAQIDGILEEKRLRTLEYSLQEVEEVPIDPDTGKRKLVRKELE